ncbi:MAG: hypothetical protein ACSNEK_07780 [Parachlamydiaceae bacterium]
MKQFFTAILFLYCFVGYAEAEVFKDKLSNIEEFVDAEKSYQLALELLEGSSYEDAASQFQAIIEQCSGFSKLAECYYYLGVSSYHLSEYDLANSSFSQYLKSTNQPKFFEETLGYKYAIAEKFRLGAKRRLFETKKMPKWASGQSLALQIYDEVIFSLPCHELAALSLFSKADIQWKNREWRDAVESYQTLIRRFAKHELAPESYLCINKVYLEQAEHEFQNPDLIALAQINVRKFAKDFPKDSRVDQAENDLRLIQEIYARGLFETGRYYERTSRKRASVIYYHSAIHQFPDTKIAELCRERIAVLAPGLIQQT